jgi:hypothetical protein
MIDDDDNDEGYGAIGGINDKEVWRLLECYAVWLL